MMTTVTRSMFGGALPAVALALLSGCSSSSSPVIVNGVQQGGSTAPLASGTTPTVVMGNTGRSVTANPLGMAALTMQDLANQAVVGVQQVGSPLAPQSNVYTTTPGMVVVSPSREWKPFPGVNNARNGVYVLGAGGQPTPANAPANPLTNPLTPQQTQNAVNTAGLLINRPR